MMMEGIRHICQVGSPRSRREKSAGEGSHEGSVKGGRAKLRPSISRRISPDIATIMPPHHTMTTYHDNIPEIAPIVWPYRTLITCLSMPDIALESTVSLYEEPVGLAVIRAHRHGQHGRSRTGLDLLFEPGPRCTERSTQS